MLVKALLILLTAYRILHIYTSRYLDLLVYLTAIGPTESPNVSHSVDTDVSIPTLDKTVVVYCGRSQLACHLGDGEISAASSKFQVLNLQDKKLVCHRDCEDSVIVLW